MDLKVMAPVFGIMFLAELGDKSQLATLLFAAKSPGSLPAIFIAASLALAFATGLGVLAGGVISQYVDQKALTVITGCGFVLIGAWTLWSGLRVS